MQFHKFVISKQLCRRNFEGTRTTALAKALAGIKANSARWANETGNKVEWQKGYGAFSVSASNVPAVVRYIQNQEANHRKISFADEFRPLLKKHGVEYDPRFVRG